MVGFRRVAKAPEGSDPTDARKSGENPSTMRPRFPSMLLRVWRKPHWLVRDGVLALLVGALLLGSQLYFDNRATHRGEGRAHLAADQAERRENLRFVRDHSSTALVDRPFAGIDLRGQNLQGLHLVGAVFTGAHLEGVDFEVADLESADLTSALLHGAKLTYADLRGAHLVGSDLTEADLSGADLRHASIKGANLTGANLENVHWDGLCYGDGTIWPNGFQTPPEAEGGCGV